MKIEGRNFHVVVSCRDCGAELNRTVPMTGQQIYDDWGRLAISSGLVTGPCKKGCRSTFSDLNINTDLEVKDAETGKVVKFATFKLAGGHFYSEDHNNLCVCAKADDELYEGKDYPTIHGPCGKFVMAYQRAS